MKKASMLTLGFVALCCLASGQSLPGPILESGLMPKYPPMAVIARIEGEVNVTFVLNAKGDVESVDVKSGPGMLKLATAEIVKSWKFTLPNPAPVKREFDTIFKYHFSGKELESGKTPRLTIVVDSFRRIEVMSDAFNTQDSAAY
jgi:TonB family protein